ncbi:hypothetical protein WR25_09728 [Diploscapter pachys]|uniref:Uncharacterized protein n=1 Tax=Diploscapter pachys TaxID=2018661 RepID=A0A2A2J3P1_9BILA|nr:hypothetical protein WR25_09728 [Diploscapter pachys]
MDDLSGETVASQAETNETRPDKQSGEELSACLQRTYWNRLPVEMQIEIVRQKNLDHSDKLNLLCAYPDLFSAISKSYPHDNSNAADGGEGTEAEPPNTYIDYESEKKMFSVEIFGPVCSRQPHRIFGVEHNRVVFRYLDSESKHMAILLGALESTSTTTKTLYCTGAKKANFLLSFAFAKVLKPSCLELDFENEKWSTLNEVVEAFPTLSELNKLTVFGSVQTDDDSLLSHLSKFPPSLSFYHTYFLHDGYAVEFLRTLVSTKFEEGSAAATALKRVVNWTFDMYYGMSYESETEEEETTSGYKLLSELVADIIPSDSEIVNLDSATGAVERHIFELHLALGNEQHVIYVKEEVDHTHEIRLIQLANRIEDFNEILDSPDSSTTSDVDEQLSSSDDDPDSDMVDSDEDDEFADDDY